MPKYFGGKALIAKRLWRFLKSQIGNDKKTFFEPFCGMLNVGFLALQDGFTCLFNDLNPDVMRIWNGLKDGWLPPETISKEEYLKLKVAEDSILRSYVGYAYSYRGIFFSRGYDTTQEKKKEPFKRGILKVVPYFKKCTFTNKSYSDFNPKDMIIYCDPPYRGYDNGEKYFKFDSDLFWNKMREWSKDNTVFISEYEAPDDFEVVWETDVKITVNSGKKTIKKVKHEKLFRYKL